MSSEEPAPAATQPKARALIALLESPWRWSLAGAAIFCIGFFARLLISHYTDLGRVQPARSILDAILLGVFFAPVIALVADAIMAARFMFQRRFRRAVSAGLAALFSIFGPVAFVVFLLSLSGGFPG